MQKPLKIWISKVKNFERISIIAILCGLVVIFAAWYAVTWLIARQTSEVYYNNVNNGSVRTYSLNGKITKLDLPNIELEVGQVIVENNQNVLIYKKYTVVVNGETEFFTRAEDQTFRPGFSEDVKSDSAITVYSEQNPYENETITANKIEVN